jgi:hypothetical protein
MRRAVLMAVATMSLLGASAMADDFTFSFTDATGTVTGEIFGLQNNATGSATEVLITSYPASLGSIQDLIATDWDVVDNDFTETNGVLLGAGFVAEDTHDPLEPTLILEGGANLYTNDGTVGPITAITFAPAPVPEPFSWFLLLTVMLAVAIVKRSRRRTDGLDDQATRMRS